MLYLATMHFLMRNLQSITLLLALGTMGLFASSLSAQYNLDYGFCIGTGNYLGDIGGDAFSRRDFVADLHLNQTRLSSHVFVRYRVSRIFAVRGQLGTVYLQDDDALSSYLPRASRNASFRNFVNELSFRTEVTVFQRPLITRYTSRFRVGINTYLTLGVTGFSHAPQAQLDELAIAEHFEPGSVNNQALSIRAQNGEWFDLRSLETEGVAYGKASVGFPIGGGFSFIVNNKIRLGLELVWNLTLTDHLDDVSGTYADPSTLSPEGIVLSSPSSQTLIDELGVPWGLGYHQFNPEGRTIRGNPENNDSYGTLQVTVSKVVRGSSRFRDFTYGKRRRTVKRKAPKPGNRGIGRGRAKF